MTKRYLSAAEHKRVKVELSIFAGRCVWDSTVKCHVVPKAAGFLSWKGQIVEKTQNEESICSSYLHGCLFTTEA